MDYELAEELGMRVYCECGLPPEQCMCGVTEEDFKQIDEQNNEK